MTISTGSIQRLARGKGESERGGEGGGTNAPEGATEGGEEPIVLDGGRSVEHGRHVAKEEPGEGERARRSLEVIVWSEELGKEGVVEDGKEGEGHEGVGDDDGVERKSVKGVHGWNEEKEDWGQEGGR